MYSSLQEPVSDILQKDSRLDCTRFSSSKVFPRYCRANAPGKMRVNAARQASGELTRWWNWRHTSATVKRSCGLRWDKTCIRISILPLAYRDVKLQVHTTRK